MGVGKGNGVPAGDNAGTTAGMGGGAMVIAGTVGTEGTEGVTRGGEADTGGGGDRRVGGARSESSASPAFRITGSERSSETRVPFSPCTTSVVEGTDAAVGRGRLGLETR